MKKAVAMLAVASVTVLTVLTVAAVASAVPVQHHPVTICHRTNSVTNPYVIITVDDDAVDGIGGSDHFGQHLGPIFDPANPPPPPHNGDQWGDIIPPTANDGFPLGHAGLNWPAGSALLAAGCNFPEEQPEVEGSLSTPSCLNPNIVATGTNPTDAQVTFQVFVNGILVDAFDVAANSTGTSASIPVKDGDVVVLKGPAGETLDTVNVDLDCATTTTPPPVTTTPPPVVTTPPPVVTTPPPVVTTTTTPPPPVGGGNPPPGPGGNPNPPPNNPPPENLNPPNELAFTGPEAALPIGALAVALATAGSGLMWLGRKRRIATPPRPDLDD